MEFSAKQIATFIQGEIVGDENATVHTFAKIEEGIPGAISFLSNPKYIPYLYETQSSIVLVNKDFTPEQEVKATMIKVDNAYESLAKLLNLYEQSKPKRTGIDPRAYVAETAKIGKDVYIAPFAYVGDHAEVGDNTVIHPHATIGSGAKVGNDCIIYANATIYHDCRVGNRCILHAGCVIGADGFGFAPTPEGYEKIPQIGITLLEDNVEIGANTCVDRATMGATIVHSGVKLDNLVHWHIESKNNKQDKNNYQCRHKDFGRILNTVTDTSCDYKMREAYGTEKTYYRLPRIGNKTYEVISKC